MKTYTDIKQSKKLAEILPIESADMRYGYIAPYDCKQLEPIIEAYNILKKLDEAKKNRNH